MIEEIQTQRAKADSLVASYKKSGLMPSLSVNPNELLSFEDHERLVAMAVQHALRTQPKLMP
jgi:hypothetical protein